MSMRTYGGEVARHVDRAHLLPRKASQICIVAVLLLVFLAMCGAVTQAYAAPSKAYVAPSQAYAASSETCAARSEANAAPSKTFLAQTLSSQLKSQAEYHLYQDEVSFSGLEESYGYTGLPISVSFSLTQMDQTLGAGIDYTVRLTAPDGTEIEAQAKEATTEKASRFECQVIDKGVYTLAITGIGVYDGTVETTFEVCDYFSVYVKENENATPVLAKVFSESQFADLKSDAHDPIAALFWDSSKYTWRVSFSYDYVMLESVLDAAGVLADWQPGAHIQYGTGEKVSNYSYEDIQAMHYFYPRAIGDLSPTTEIWEAPFVFTLKEFSGTTDRSNNSTAGTFVEKNKYMCNTNNTPRILFGITEQDYMNPRSTTAQVAGSRLWSHTTSITLITSSHEQTKPIATPPVTTKPSSVTAKATNPVKVKARTKIFKAKRTKTVRFKAAQAFKVVGNKAGALRYKKVSGNKKITVQKNGVINVAKGLRKKTYTIKVAWSVAASQSYKAASGRVALKVRVR